MRIYCKFSYFPLFLFSAFLIFRFSIFLKMANILHRLKRKMRQTHSNFLSLEALPSVKSTDRLLLLLSLLHQPKREEEKETP